MPVSSKIIHLTCGVIIALALAACAPPLSTAKREWTIRHDEEGMTRKQAFLDRLSRIDTTPRGPNIILIVVDDLGKAEVSAYGHSPVATPHIDQLAAQGVRFADGYVSSPVCSPSRAGLLTGRHQARFGYETQPMEYYPNNLLVYWLGKKVMNTDNWVLRVPPRFPAESQWARQGLPLEEINLAELLQARGYRTACIGKWHLGYGKEYLPLRRGFDEHYGFYGAFSLYTANRRSPEVVAHVPRLFSSRHQWREGRKGTGAIVRDGRRLRETRYLTFALRDEAMRFMENHRDGPFFLYLSFSAPHEPFQAPLSHYERFAHVAEEGKRVYYAMIQALDEAVGAVHERVKTLGLEDNTLIFFISDNGGASYTGLSDNAPYKGGKLTMFEGGVNVPFLLKWQGVLPAGSIYPFPVSALDILPTVAAAADCSLPDDRTYDGVDLAPFLRGQKKGAPHDALFWRADHIQAMRAGDWKFVRSLRDHWAELYHIGEDRYERYDLREANTEVLRQLIEAYDAWQDHLRAPRWPRLMDYRFLIDGKTFFFPA
jgi:arylsulfatase A-like enzyme